MVGASGTGSGGGQPARRALGEEQDRLRGARGRAGARGPGHTGERASDGSAVCHLGSPWPRDNSAWPDNWGHGGESLTQPRGSLLSTVGLTNSYFFKR